MLGNDWSKAASDAITHHGVSDLLPDRIPHLGYVVSIRCCFLLRQGSPSNPTPATLPAATVLRKLGKRSTGTKRLDQADSLVRPRRRRFAITRRPALLDMRLRKPCFFARRRTFGWKVLFTIRPDSLLGGAQSHPETTSKRSGERIEANEGPLPQVQLFTLGPHSNSNNTPVENSRSALHARRFLMIGSQSCIGRKRPLQQGRTGLRPERGHRSMNTKTSFGRNLVYSRDPLGCSC